MTNNTTSDNAIVIERRFDAPVDLIWQMWTQPEHFKKWYGPNGASVPVAEMDVRVGGARRVCMELQTPDGTMQMWTAGEFTEVAPNERLVFTESVTDADGNAMAHGSGLPQATLVTIVLENVDGATRMTLTHAGLPVEAEGGRGGWNQAFDKLADYVGTVVSGS